MDFGYKRRRGGKWDSQVFSQKPQDAMGRKLREDPAPWGGQGDQRFTLGQASLRCLVDIPI